MENTTIIGHGTVRILKAGEKPGPGFVGQAAVQAAIWETQGILREAMIRLQIEENVRLELDKH